MSEMKVCQSCAMPLTNKEELGTNADGSLNEAYCKYCFNEGKFVGEMTMDEMIEFCAPIVVKEKVYPDVEAAKQAMRGYFPTLKRWK